MNNKKPGVCPECGSDHFEADAPEFTNALYRCAQAMHCIDCDCYWYDDYWFEDKRVAVHGRNYKEHK